NRRCKIPLKGYWCKRNEKGEWDCYKRWLDEDLGDAEFFSAKDYFANAKGAYWYSVAGEYYMNEKCKGHPCFIHCPLLEGW
ncbi:MAG TPA: hypothetical protein PLN14_07645, partial [Candidatus Hydrothermia bacterium]|nr:hypothetical protein [Candidatus Hydrothermia bacterium]